MPGTKSAPSANQVTWARRTASVSRRYRTTIAAAVAISSPRKTGSRASAATCNTGVIAAGAANTCRTSANGASNGVGSKASSAVKATGMPIRPAATARQRGPGSRPVGKYSASRAGGTYRNIQVPGCRDTATADTGTRSGRCATAEA